MNFPLIVCASLFLILLHGATACNEAVCASVVSKCMLTQSCKCDLKNCSCCKECFNCLGNLYDECCSCVDMCPKRDDDDDSLSTKSHIEKFKEPLPGLFQVLTDHPDPSTKWLVYTMRNSISDESFPYKVDKHVKLDTKNEQEVDPQKAVNCTAAYFPNCMPWKKCREACRATGASKFRWFHDGCCECVGPNCIGYGSDQSLCAECPKIQEDELSEDDLSNLYYDDESEYTIGDGADKQAVDN